MRRLNFLAGATLLFATLAPSRAFAVDPSPTEEDQAPAADPHATPSGMFRPPEDTVTEDATTPPGTISVALRDEADHPIANETVMLAAINNSVAKGESRKHFTATTDDAGIATFSGQGSQEPGANTAFRVTVARDGGTFGARPFQMAAGKSMRVALHAYPVTHNLAETLVVIEVQLGIEMKDDRIQFEQSVGIFNVGKTAWVPTDAFITLPTGYTAFNAQAVMGGAQAISNAEGRGAQIVGTFAPGEHELSFRWQLPWAGEENMAISLGLPPRTALQRVVASSSPGMELLVSGFDKARAIRLKTGQTVLGTERQFRNHEQPSKTLDVELRHLPTRGPGPRVALGLASAIMLSGLWVGFTQRRGKTRVAEGREELLAELDELEALRTSGEVGPKTYEARRKHIIEMLARTFAVGAA